MVIEENGNVTGFIVLEFFEKNVMPQDFQNVRLKEKISDRWAYIVAFTTATNYRDKKSGFVLLLAAEDVAKNTGCTEISVPLTKDHLSRAMASSNSTR